jgi:bifunctional non-homologous end joining protein LigD
MKKIIPHRPRSSARPTVFAVVAKVDRQRNAELRLLGKDGWQPVGQVTIPVAEPLPAVGQVVEIRYHSADPNTRRLEQAAYLRRRSDVDVTDCGLRQLQFPAASRV